MARKALLAASALGLWALSGAAQASGDGGCYARWKLFDKGRNCFSRAIIAPANDTRVNLLFLLRDRSGAGTVGLSYPKQGWDDEGFGQTFLDWSSMQAGLYGEKPDAASTGQPDYTGSRCASLASGRPAFVAALTASKRLPAIERDRLAAARGRLDTVCANGVEARYAAMRRAWSTEPEKPLPALPAWPEGISSAAGKAFLGYLQASDAFYGERWGEARFSFAGLGRSGEPWVAETAAYMLARVELNAAMATAYDQYGSFDGLEKVDKEAVGRAGAAIAAYLKAYPQGRYAASARGLRRRVLWLAGDRAALANEYERMLGAVRGADEQAAQLVQEIDNMLLFPWGNDSSSDARGALLLAIRDLAHMRREGVDTYQPDSAGEPPKLGAAALDAQQASFAGQPELWSFLQANHAFYVAKDFKRILQLLPDDARKPAYAPLAFSRQMLRGMALAQLGDRNEAGFWLELMNGATGLWQRPTVELALAMNYERNGRLAAVFAKGSPITDSDIRIILLRNSAGPEILRGQALDAARPLAERNYALFALLSKQLTYSDYSGFLASMKLAVPRTGDDGRRLGVPESPVEQFKRPASGAYPCRSLVETAQTLSRNPQDVAARLCLGEFWRINGQETFGFAQYAPSKDELGGAANEFPGKPNARGPIYAAIIADPRAAANDKAYALYRAINCYGPSGYNDCGGPDVDKSQRRAWFQRLKRDYANSQWARQQSIYW